MTMRLIWEKLTNLEVATPDDINGSQTFDTQSKKPLKHIQTYDNFQAIFELESWHFNFNPA